MMIDLKRWTFNEGFQNFRFQLNENAYSVIQLFS